MRQTSYFTNINAARDPSRAEQKRKRTASGAVHSEGPSAKRTPQSPVKTTAYTFVLVDNTKAAHGTGYKVPDKNAYVPIFVTYLDAERCVRLNKLHANNLVQQVVVPQNATSEDIRNSVSEAFRHLPVIQNAPVSMHGFVWLTKETRGRGTRGVLKVNRRVGDFKLQDLEWCVRSAVTSYLCN